MLDPESSYTLRAETFAGINFRVFQSSSRKFLPLEILNHQNAKVFHAKSWIFFKARNAKVFSKLIKSKKNHKNGEISKVMIYFYLNRRQLQ